MGSKEHPQQIGSGFNQEELAKLILHGAPTPAKRETRKQPDGNTLDVAMGTTKGTLLFWVVDCKGRPLT